MSDLRRERDPASPARRALQVVFCIDCSGSMAGDRIGAVNDALRLTIPALQATAEGYPDVELFVRVLAFADKSEWRVAGEGSPLVAGGETNMGVALRELGDALSLACGAGPHTPPVVILISDGLPTDDGEAGLAAFARSPFGRDAQRIAIAVGSDADIGLLQSFVGRAGLAPLLAHNPEMLREQIAWAACALVEAAASPACAAAQTLAAEAARLNAQIGDALW